MLLEETILFYGSESNSSFLQCRQFLGTCVYPVFASLFEGLGGWAESALTYYQDLLPLWLTLGGRHLFFFFTTSYSVPYPQCLAYPSRSKIISWRNEHMSWSPFSLTWKQRIECNLTMFGGSQWVKRNFVCCFSYSQIYFVMHNAVAIQSILWNYRHVCRRFPSSQRQELKCR